MLNQTEIKKLIREKNLIENYITLDKQITPNGFDLTVSKIFEFTLQGALDFSNKERVIPEGKEILSKKINPQDKFGWWELKRGIYRVKTNEIINLPDNLVALAFSRTSLLRLGGFTHHGVWDAGFKGRSEFVLAVENPAGIRLKENARIAQLVFFRVEETEEYKGVYQDLR